MNIKNKHWSEYWRSGVQTSLPQDFKHNYDGEIYQYWQNVVSKLPNGAHVLDVCTGNGAVALIVAKIAIEQDKVFTITAVDITEINCKSILANNPVSETEMINFISHCPIEEISLKEFSKQDLVVSQFGIEYSDISRTAPVLAELMKPNGQLNFIAHGRKSDVFKYMEKEERVYSWLERIGMLKTFESFLNGDIDGHGLQHAINQIISQHRPPKEMTAQPLFQSWIQFIGQIRQSNGAILNQQKAPLEQFVQGHTNARLRGQDMLNVAKKIKHKDWITPLLDHGFQIENTGEIIYQGKNLAGDFYQFIFKDLYSFN